MQTKQCFAVFRDECIVWDCDVVSDDPHTGKGIKWKRLMLYYCDMMWSWWDWTIIFLIQCYDTVGRVIRPVKLLLTANKLALKTVPEMAYNVSTISVCHRKRIVLRNQP